MDARGRKIARIELKLRDLNQLFHTLDPSPFVERSLDEAAEAFIVSWARDLPRTSELELLVHLSEPPRDAALAVQLESAVQNHFAYQANAKRQEFRELMTRGRTSLVIGLAFMAACIVGGNALGGSEPSALRVLGRESLLIGGWVAMWRPLEILLYDWWAVLRVQRSFERLSRMAVRIVVAG